MIVRGDGSIACFENLKNQGKPPLNTRVRFLLAEMQNGIGYAVAEREMDLGTGEKRIIFTLMLRLSTDNRRQAFREHAVIRG